MPPTHTPRSHGTSFWLKLKMFTIWIIHYTFEPLVFNTFWDNGFQKSAWRHKADLAIKKVILRSASDHLKFGRPSSCCYIQRFSLEAFLVLARERFWWGFFFFLFFFYHIRTRWLSCIMMEPLNKLSKSLQQKTEGPMWNCWKLAK